MALLSPDSNNRFIPHPFQVGIDTFDQALQDPTSQCLKFHDSAWPRLQVVSSI